ncbi:hypothetical protein AB6H17_04485 [Proteus vulgaris]|uniref:hypothetical protein n=1 Tax=Proteus vulgaris TaxID=585 RepID=UPI0034DD9F9E
MMMEKHEVKQRNSIHGCYLNKNQHAPQLHQELLDEPMKKVIRDSSAVIVNPTTCWLLVFILILIMGLCR